MNRSRRRRLVSKRARYANRVGIHSCGIRAGRWVMAGYRLDQTWHRIRLQH